MAKEGPSGNALGIRASSKPDVDRVANELADADVGVIVFASTTQGGLARGLDDIQQGAFTAALVEGIEAGKADLTKDFLVSVAELEKYISDRVKELTKGGQKPVTTKPKAVEDWNFIRVPDVHHYTVRSHTNGLNHAFPKPLVSTYPLARVGDGISARTRPDR